jgi:prophage regulatory protein
MTAATLLPTRGLPIPVVAERIARSRASIYSMMDKRSPAYDPTFPIPFKIGARTLFVEAEIENWLQAKIAARRMRLAATVS